jgi:hypothetical protein
MPDSSSELPTLLSIKVTYKEKEMLLVPNFIFWTGCMLHKF